MTTQASGAEKMNRTKARTRRMNDTPQNPKTGLMICGQGSRDDGAVNEFNALAGHLKKRLPEYDIESGFLEFASPVLRTGLDKLKERGSERILCLPGMLFAAGHVKNDLPSEVNEFAHANPDLESDFKPLV